MDFLNRQVTRPVFINDKHCLFPVYWLCYKGRYPGSGVIISDRLPKQITAQWHSVRNSSVTVASTAGF